MTYPGIANKEKSRFRAGARILLPLFILAAGAAGFLPNPFQPVKPVTPAGADASQGRKFRAAPGFKLKDLAGKEVKLADFKGKVVIVNFWATWCGPCTYETPALVRFRQAYAAKGVEVIGISLDDDGPELVKKFVQQYQIPYPIVMANQSVVNAYGPIGAIPTTFLIDKETRIRNRYVGLFSFEQLKKEVESLL